MKVTEDVLEGKVSDPGAGFALCEASPAAGHVDPPPMSAARVTAVIAR